MRSTSSPPSSRRRHTDGESIHYLESHRHRGELLLALISAFASRRILDVGASWEADAMRARLPDTTVDSLGWLD